MNIIEAAKNLAVAELELTKQTRELEDQISVALSKQLPVGEVIDLSIHPRDRKNYLLQVRTTRGNDRGANKFCIASAPAVTVNRSTIELSTWSCEATPISSNTGQPLKGNARGVGQRETVRLTGNLIAIPINLEGVEYIAYGDKLLEDLMA